MVEKELVILSFKEHVVKGDFFPVFNFMNCSNHVNIVENTVLIWWSGSMPKG
jgi:hypothetical protein